MMFEKAPEIKEAACADLVAGAILPRSVLLIDSYALRREAFQLMLSAHAKDIRFQSIPAAPLAPSGAHDVILLAVDRSEAGAAQACAELASMRQFHDKTPVAALVHDEDATLTVKLLTAGFAGVISMSLEVSLVLAAIRLMCCGGAFIPKHILGAHAGCAGVPAPSLSNALTRREKEILDFVREGKPNKIIAHRLSITESTVKVHLQNIMRKMKVTNRTEVAVLGRSTAFPFQHALAG